MEQADSETRPVQNHDPWPAVRQSSSTQGHRFPRIEINSVWAVNLAALLTSDDLSNWLVGETRALLNGLPGSSASGQVGGKRKLADSLWHHVTMMIQSGDLGIKIDLESDAPGVVLQRYEADKWRDYLADGQPGDCTC